MSVAIAGLFYIATLIFIGGLAFRIYTYSNTPSPLKIPTMPAPTTQSGVVWRMIREVTIFESLFKSNKWLWLFGWMFHLGLLLVLIRHLRYVTEPVWGWVALIQPFGVYAGMAMLAGLLGLLVRRIVLERIRYISSPSDYAMLALLFGIGATGLLMKYVTHTDIVEVKSFMLGVMYFDIKPLPGDPMLVIHLLLVVALMVIFPVSKLLHAPGVFFSPTRNQVDDAREKRHLAPWAAEMEK